MTDANNFILSMSNISKIFPGVVTISIAEKIKLGRKPHRIVVLWDRKKAAEYSGIVDDQTLIQTMAGDL